MRTLPGHLEVVLGAWGEVSTEFTLGGSEVWEHPGFSRVCPLGARGALI